MAANSYSYFKLIIGRKRRSVKGKKNSSREHHFTNTYLVARAEPTFKIFF